MGRAALALAATVMVVAAAGSATAGSGQVTFRELTAGSRGANLPGERMADVGQVLRSASQATRRLRAWGLDPSAARAVDFRRKSLIAVLAEYHPSGGYRARVSRVVVRGRKVVVTARVRYEGGDFAVSDLERPWVVIAVDRAAVARVSGAVQVRRP